MVCARRIGKFAAAPAVSHGDHREQKKPEPAGHLPGFQGKAQLEYIYGHLAEVMLSQPATNIWLKTKEPKAGQWVSEFIGKVEIERMRETHFDGSRSGRNFSLDRQEEPLVMESEISGLEDLHAFLNMPISRGALLDVPYLDVPSTSTQVAAARAAR